ncbi:hypothetical protein BZA77DRAFT_320396 [Pyronema omphalodes]|nr:hypothetical protein BZA77DRAFT_320396 [Pyronema omphalodes]
MSTAALLSHLPHSSISKKGALCSFCNIISNPVMKKTLADGTDLIECLKCYKPSEAQTYESHDCGSQWKILASRSGGVKVMECLGCNTIVMCATGHGNGQVGSVVPSFSARSLLPDDMSFEKEDGSRKSAKGEDRYSTLSKGSVKGSAKGSTASYAESYAGSHAQSFVGSTDHTGLITTLPVNEACHQEPQELKLVMLVVSKVLNLRGQELLLVMLLALRNRIINLNLVLRCL